MKKLLLLTALTGLLFSFQTMAAGEHRKGKASELSKEAKIAKKERKALKRIARSEKRAIKKLEKIDTSADGNVDLSEYLVYHESRFNDMDADSNGYLTAEEMKLWASKLRTKVSDAKKAKLEKIANGE